MSFTYLFKRRPRGPNWVIFNNFKALLTLTGCTSCRHNKYERWKVHECRGYHLFNEERQSRSNSNHCDVCKTDTQLQLHTEEITWLHGDTKFPFSC